MAHTLLEEFLAEMELSMPGPHPFRHRTLVIKRSLGAGCPELTAIVDDEMVSIWETIITTKDNQTLWGLNFLMYARGKVVTTIGNGDKVKVNPPTPDSHRERGEITPPPRPHL